MARFAIIENDAVINVVIGDSTELVQSVFPDNIVIEITDPESGVGPGWSYDKLLNKMYQTTCVHPSWTLDSNKDWQPPTPKPTDGKEYGWDDENNTWVAHADVLPLSE